MNIPCIVLLSCLSIAYSQEVLRYVQVVYRHGDRSPVRIGPHDHDFAKLWPCGRGQLTDVGIRQHFELGKWFRMRYRNFLKLKYDHKEVYVRSTDVDRTLMSAQSNLAGLYFENNTIVSGLKWRPVPVHTMPVKSDPFAEPFNCKKYNEKIQQLYSSHYYKSLFKKYDKVLKLMRKMSKNKNLSFKDSWSVYDSLFCARSHNMSTWVSDETFAKIGEVFALNWKALFHGKEIAKLAGGRFLEEIVSKMKSYVDEGYLQPEKMRMHSGHDTNIASLLAVMGLFDGVQPPYASTLLFELKQKPGTNVKELHNWVVRMYYKTNANQSATDLPETKIRGCKSDPCTLEDFIDFTKTLVLTDTDFKKSCHK